MKNVEIKKELMLNYDSLWPGLPKPEIAAVLAEVPLTPAIEQVAYLLQRVVTRHKDQLDFHPRELKMWSGEMTSSTRAKVAEYVEGTNLYAMPEFRLTNQRNCLSLIEDLLDSAAGTGVALTEAHQDAIFQALLLINGAYLAGQEAMFNWDGGGDADTFLDIVLPAKIANLGITKIRDHQAQLIKSIWLFGFFVRDADYRRYLSVFLNYYGFTQFEEYVRLVFHPYLTYMSIPPLNWSIFTVSRHQKA